MPMKRNWINQRSLAVAMLCAGLGTVVVAADAPKAVKATGDKYPIHSVIAMEEAGKQTRKCTILAATKQPDGSMTYTLKANDNGEMITIHDGKKIEVVETKAPVVAEAKPPVMPEVKPEMKPVLVAKPVSVSKPEGVSMKSMLDAKKTAEATDLKRPTPLSVDDDPLFRGPAEMEASKSKIVSNVNEAAKSKASASKGVAPTPAVATKETSKENKGFFTRMTSREKPAAVAKETVVETVPSTMTAKPVIVDTGKAGVASVGEPVMAPTMQPIANMPTRMVVPVMPASQIKNTPAPGFMPTLQNPLQKQMQVPVTPMVPKAAIPAMPKELELQGMLKDALKPSERELAAMQLASMNGPTVKTALLTAAKEDPAATVRACCLKSLVKIAPHDGAVKKALAEACDDADAKVRNQATELLAK
jgi:hypothetical protein